MKSILTDESYRLFEKHKDYLICIFGYGQMGKVIEKYIRTKIPNMELLLCDNSSVLRKENLRVKRVEDIYLNEQIFFVLGSKLYPKSMMRQLEELGINKDRILMVNWDYVDEILYEENKAKKLTPLTKIQFEVDLSEHCNLNCRYCSQFSPIAKEQFYDLEQYKNDMYQMAKIFDGIAERIYLIGGEPLLNEGVVEYILIARKSFPDAEISIFSNGLLLKNMTEEFWDALITCNINIIVTKYPINADYEEMERLVASKGVKFTFFKFSKDFKYMNKLPLDLDGRQDIEKNFVLCSESNNCIKLKNGWLYTCTRPAAIFKFNEFFKKDLKVSQEDYIDIYEVESAEQVLEQLAKPIPFCRYCKLEGRNKDYEWGVSEHIIEEYI